MRGTSSPTPPSGLPWSARAIERASLLASPATLAQALTSRLPTDQRWSKPPHLALLSRLITDAIWAGDGRLIVTMPLRHGKSQFISHWLPAWFLERWPRKHVILASCEAAFAATWGRKARNSIDTHAEALTVWGDPWSKAEGGGMMTAGIGGKLTGFGADVLIRDGAVPHGAPRDGRPRADAVER